MIITFVGHSKINKSNILHDRIRQVILENIKQNERIMFYCGGYGDFDTFCIEICISIRKQIPNCELVYVTPYILTKPIRREKHLNEFDIYDSIVYPPIEKTPPKFAIIKRNEWMINEADLIIAYVTHTYGGARKALEYAAKKKKRIINLADTQ